MSHGVGHRRVLDPALLWLQRRPAATATIRLLVWEPPCAAGAALKTSPLPPPQKNPGINYLVLNEKRLSEMGIYLIPIT